jgi:hypothetical protein
MELTGDQSGTRYALFPGHAEQSVSILPEDFTFFPVQSVRDVWRDVWWRIKRIKCEVSLSFDSGAVVFAGDGAVDFFAPAVTTETDRYNSGIFRYSGGVGSFPDAFTVNLMEIMGEDGADGPVYYWRVDLDPPQMLPRFYMDGGVSLTTGGDVSATWGSGEEPPVIDRTPFYGLFYTSFFGLPIRIWVNPDTAIDSFDVAFSALEYWEYRNEFGNEAIYDPTTGTQLLPNLPIYFGNSA